MTDIFVVFDFLWKFVFFVSILSTFYFCSVLFLPKLFKKTSAIKIMAGIKTSKIILLMSFIANAFFLVFFDKELGIDCFGHFAIKEGSFGLTRMISIIWLIGFILYIVKDAVCYFWSFKKLNNCVIGSKT
ncbi:MAG: hypothetical protein KDD45_14935, partial [Bdellovibrionales bacterium]|nr:hypothetical protein [Bdellovibrionales bacterium]